MFVLPLNVTGRLVFIGLIVLDTIGILSGAGSLAHFAHLGGLFAGFFYARSGKHPTFLDLLGFRRLRIRIARPPEPVAPRPSSRFRAEPVAKASPGKDFMASEVDPILDKISAHGIHSLTAEERAILEKAQKQMAKR